MLDTNTLIEVAEYGLKGDRPGLLSYLSSLAALSSNKNRRRLHNQLLSLIEHYSNEKPIAGPSSFASAQLGVSSREKLPQGEEDIWLPKGVDARLSKIIKLNQISAPSQKLISDKFNKILLYGPPGSGKTTIGFHLAKALNKQMHYVKVSDVISSKFGETLKNIAEVFQMAGDGVVFIDEFDAFGKDRSDTNDVGELKRIVNSIIQTLDFYSSGKIVIAATNLIGSIDPAILRRFPVKILVDALDKDELRRFLLFLSQGSPKLIDFSEKDNDLLVEILSELKLTTAHDVRTIFEQVFLTSFLIDKETLKIEDFIEVIFVEGYLSNAISSKGLSKGKKEIFNEMVGRMEKLGYTKQKIADFLGVHRNSLLNYAKEL